LQAFRENIKSPTDATSAVNAIIGLRKAFQRARRRACFISSKLIPGGDLSIFFDQVQGFFLLVTMPRSVLAISYYMAAYRCLIE
jgi:hypothetical protein